MAKEKKAPLLYWYIEGRKFNTATEAAKHFNVSQHRIKKWCGRIKDSKGVIAPKRNDCYVVERSWEEEKTKSTFICEDCGTKVEFDSVKKFEGTNLAKRTVCDKCKIKRSNHRTGRTSEMLNEIHYTNMGTVDSGRKLTKTEIKEIEHLCTPPIQRKRPPNFTIPI